MTASRLIPPIVAAGLGAAALAATATPSFAADLSLRPGHRVTRVTQVARVRTVHVYRHWRERCAYAGYYCLYAEYGFVYHYPFDDRPVAYAHRRHNR